MNTNKHTPSFRNYCFTWERIKRELEAQGKEADRAEIDRLVADEMKKPVSNDEFQNPVAVRLLTTSHGIRLG